MSKQTVVLASLALCVIVLGYMVWVMQNDMVATNEALFDLQQVERARKAKRKLPT